MTTTRPGELSRIQEIAKGDPYRTEVLTFLAIQNERSERQEKILSALSAWQIEHDKKDEIRFERGDARMSAIERSVGGVSSGVNDWNDAKAQAIGMKKLVIGVVAVIGTIGAAVIGLVEIMKALHGNHP